jgi:hypothetical protein
MAHLDYLMFLDLIIPETLADSHPGSPSWFRKLAGKIRVRILTGFGFTGARGQLKNWNGRFQAHPEPNDAVRRHSG